MCPLFYGILFYKVSLWEKKVFWGGRSASSDNVMTRFVHYDNWLQSLALLLWAWFIAGK